MLLLAVPPLDKVLVPYILIISTVVGMKPTLPTAPTQLPLHVRTHKMLEFSAGLNVRKTIPKLNDCVILLFVTLTVLCNNSDIRLAGGSDQYEGRVEICFNETWGTICDGSWSTNDANVACRQLGYAATGARAFTNAFFGPGIGPIYLDDFLCRGTENRLIDCPNGGLNMIDFCNGHADDAGVRCPESKLISTFL